MIYTIGVITSLNNIFAAIVVGGIDKTHDQIQEKKRVYKECLPVFLSEFRYNVFQDEYAFLYEVFKSLKIKMFTIPQLEEIIYRNTDIILDSPYIDMKKWSVTTDNRPTTDDEKIEAFRLNLIELVIELSNQIVSEEDFASSLEIYKNFYVEQATLEMAQNMTLILGENGLLVKKTRGRKVLYKGVDDSYKYMNERMMEIRSLNETGIIEHTSVNLEWLQDNLQEEEKEEDEAILDFGINEIDSVIGSLRRSNLVSIVGPTKGGKTRFTAYLVERALSKGLNVCVWPLEGTKREWITYITACLIRRATTKINANGEEHAVRLNSKNIMFKKYESKEERELVVSAQLILADSMNRGKLSFIQGTAYCEDFLDELKYHYENKNRFDVVVLDPLTNILSRTGIPNPGRIRVSYIVLKDFISNRMGKKALALTTAQLKQTVIDLLRKNPDDTIDITGASESAEPIRSADEAIGLFSSKEERSAGRMKVYSIASRHSEAFDDFMMGSELGCAYFFSNPGLNQ